MIAGLREAKLSSNKKIKVQLFPIAKTEDLMFYLIPNLKKALQHHYSYWDKCYAIQK